MWVPFFDIFCLEAALQRFNPAIQPPNRAPTFVLYPKLRGRTILEKQKIRRNFGFFL
jgi:hypothetical protein